MILDDVIAAYRAMGIQCGDVIEVSSDVRGMVMRMRHESKMRGSSPKSFEGYMDAIIDALQNLVGCTGTLLFPTYTWGFCKGETWDYEQTCGETGLLSNQALLRDEFRRTKHPIYSFAVWGRDRDLLVSLENKDSFGADSPFAYLHEKGKFNVSLGAASFFTFTHYVEQCNHVDYRYTKDFTAPYTINGKTDLRTYSMMVRILEPQEVLTIPAESSDLLYGWGLQEKTVEGILLRAIDFRKAYDRISWDIQSNGAKHIMRWL